MLLTSTVYKTHHTTSRPWSQTLATQSCWRGPGGGSVSPPTQRRPPCKARAPLIHTREFSYRNDLVRRQANFPTPGFLCWLNNFSNVNLWLTNHHLTLKYRVGGGKGKEEEGRERTVWMREKCWHHFFSLTQWWLLFQLISQWDNQGVWCLASADKGIILLFFLSSYKKAQKLLSVLRQGLWLWTTSCLLLILSTVYIHLLPWVVWWFVYLYLWLKVFPYLKQT